MKTIRVFTVEVGSCEFCPENMYSFLRDLDFCGLDHGLTRFTTLAQNSAAITPSCPRYAETKLIEVKE